MTILELREKRNKAWEAAKAFVETKRDKDGLLSEDDAKTYAEMEQKVQNYTSEIERMQAMEAMEAELNKPVNTPITHKPMNGGKDTGDGKPKTGRASDAYRAGMLKALRSNFRTIDHDNFIYDFHEPPKRKKKSKHNHPCHIELGRKYK